MNKTERLQKSLIGLGMMLVIASCTTDDILPAVELTIDSTVLSEANGSSTLTARLNAEATSDISIALSISGSAIQSNDYSVSATQLTIPTGSQSASITFVGQQDEEVEGEETIIISLGNITNVLVLSNSEITINLQDDDADTDGDGVLDANDNCPAISGEVTNNGCPFLGFLINEVLYDPPADLPGDANNDGIRDANQDEFIEFFNSGPELDLSGYTISDAAQIRHTFPAGTILPVNGVLVLFGGGSPTGNFGGALVQTASEGSINMSNAGDLVTLRDTSGSVVLEFDINPLSGNPNESYTRNPDLTGDFVQHEAAFEGKLFSPGTKVDGSSF